MGLSGEVMIWMRVYERGRKWHNIVSTFIGSSGVGTAFLFAERRNEDVVGMAEGQVSTIKKISAKVDKRYEGNGGIAKEPG